MVQCSLNLIYFRLNVLLPLWNPHPTYFHDSTFVLRISFSSDLGSIFSVSTEAKSRFASMSVASSDIARFIAKCTAKCE